MKTTVKYEAQLNTSFTFHEVTCCGKFESGGLKYDPMLHVQTRAVLKFVYHDIHGLIHGL